MKLRSRVLRSFSSTLTSGGGSPASGLQKTEERIRIGDYRIVYVMEDAARTVDVMRIANRREVYDSCCDDRLTFAALGTLITQHTDKTALLEYSIWQSTADSCQSVNFP